MFVHRIRSVFCLLLVTSFAFAGRTDQTLRSVGSRDGLSSMFVLSLYQDVRGFVWAGTYSGLSILDGNGSRVAFKDRPEVKAEAGVMIRAIGGDDNGMVWMNTNFGLDCWDMSTGHREHHKMFTGTYEMAVGPCGDVVVLTQSGDFYAYNALHHRFEQLSTEPLAYADYHVMTIDSLRRWRVVTRTHTIEATLQADVDSHVYTTDERKITHEMGRLATAKADGEELMMVTEDGLLCVGDRSGRHAKAVHRLSNAMQLREPYSGIIRDGDDFLLSFYSGGVFRLRRTATGYEEEPTEVACGVFGMLRDNRQDIIWVATDGEGVCYLARAPYMIYNELFTDLPFPVSAPVRAIIRDAEGNLLLGTKGDGLLCYEKYDCQEKHHAVRQLTTANSGLLHNSVYALAHSIHGIVWIGSDGEGINFYNPHTGSIGTLGSNIPHLSAVHALVEVDGRFLYACSGNHGVCRLTLDWHGDEPVVADFKLLCYDAGHASQSQYISIARQDTLLWLANREQGLRCLHMTTGASNLWRLADDSIRAKNDPITVLYDPRRQLLFCGTSRGLFAYTTSEGSSHRAYDLGATMGLSDAAVRALALESSVSLRSVSVGSSDGVQHGRLWVATTEGLACRDLSSGEFNVLTVNDELKVLEFAEGAAYYDQLTGEKFFGGTNGFLVVSPPLRQLAVIHPPILFTGLKVGEHYINLPTHVNSQPTPLRLHHYENYLTVNYAVVDYLHAGRYDFQYRLKTKNTSEWHELGHARSVSFANMPPADYLLQLRYRSANYVSEPFELLFTILPPWYATTWAKLLWCVLAVATAFALYRIFRWAQVRRMIHVQQSIRQRLQLRELKQEIHQRDEHLQQLKAITAQQSPYDIVGNRVLHREDQELLERIIDIISKHIGDPHLSPNSVAEEMCMSYRTLYRRMEEISDKTLATLIRDVRMQQARQLLTQTRMTIEQVASYVGYSNRGAFYKHFAAQFGCTPRQFQANYAAEVRPDHNAQEQADPQHTTNLT